MQKQSRPVNIGGKFRLLKRTHTYSPQAFNSAPPVLDAANVARRGSAATQSSDEDHSEATAAGVGGVPDESGGSSEAANLPMRRGRRLAIVNSQHYQHAANQSSLDRSPEDSDEADCSGEMANRRRSSLALNIEVLPRIDALKERSRKLLRKQNTIADLTHKTMQTYASNEDIKRRNTKSILKLIDKRRSRSKGGQETSSLHDAMLLLPPSEFRDTYLISFKTKHWTHLCKDAGISDSERFRREAVWELFKSELIYLTDYLMVLKHCFLEPLKKLQVDGYLMFVEPEDLFGNIDELCYVSYTFSRDLISIFLREARCQQLGTLSGLTKAFKRWSGSSKNGDVYHNYCLNYHCAVAYLEILRRYEQFVEYERWCRQDQRCHRLQLSDLLVAPLQHCTKAPLLLAHIRKYSDDEASREMLTVNLERVEASLKSLEDKLKWLKNFERLQNIQQQLVWPPITELDPRAFVPEFLRSSLSAQPCELLIANPKRQLIHEGYLNLLEVNKTTEIYCFLFDDLLLLTKIKKQPRKRTPQESTYSASPTDGAVFTVHRQPIALDRFNLVDIGSMEACAKLSYQDMSITSECVIECTAFRPLQTPALNMRHAFVLVHVTRFRQIVALYTLQALTEDSMFQWLELLRESQDRFHEALRQKLARAVTSEGGGPPCTNTHSKLISKMRRLKLAKQQDPASAAAASVAGDPPAASAASAVAGFTSRGTSPLPSPTQPSQAPLLVSVAVNATSPDQRPAMLDQAIGDDVIVRETPA